LIIKVLGSAAGGGFPQINCNCRNCAAVRGGSAFHRPRTQSSLAISGDRRAWVLLNASPDLRQQIHATPELAPAPGDGPRFSPITAVVLTSGEVDHVTGLLSLREGVPFALFAAPSILAALAANSVFDALAPAHVPRMPLALGRAVELAGGLSVEAFAVPGKVALYLEREGTEVAGGEGDTIGLKIGDAATGTAFYYVPGCAAVDAALASRLRGASLVLFDGTLYTDEELIEQGLSHKSGRRMGHLSMAGPHGSMAACAGLGIGRRVYVHINNSNPVLDETSWERAEVERAGWEVGFDGMEIRL
jgi:pyrroloquinoline quinone biosynthesis protein B